MQYLKTIPHLKLKKVTFMFFLLSSAVVPAWGFILLPSSLKHIDLHNPLSWSLFRCFQYFRTISILSFQPILLISDVTKEYSNASHTIRLTTPGMEMMMEEYIAYKAGSRRDPVAFLNGAEANICFQSKSSTYILGWEPENNLHVVTIFINSPTFDLITKDAKTTFMDRLAVIGGTLGLFTGFSIISGIEVINNEYPSHSTKQLPPDHLLPDQIGCGSVGESKEKQGEGGKERACSWLMSF